MCIQNLGKQKEQQKREQRKFKAKADLVSYQDVKGVIISIVISNVSARDTLKVAICSPFAWDTGRRDRDER